MKPYRAVFTVLSWVLLAAMLLAAPAPALAAPPPAPLKAGATAWCAAGNFQGWNNSSTPLFDDGTNGDLIPGDGVFSLQYTVALAGTYEFKMVECGNWGNAYPAANAWFTTTTAGQSVLFTFDTNNHAADAGAAFLPAQYVPAVYHDNVPTSWTVVGDFNGWNNSDANTLMTDMGKGFFRALLTISTPGSYTGKVTETGSWGRQVGGSGRSIDAANVSFTTTAPNQQVVVVLDTNQWRLHFALPATAGTGAWCAAGGFNSWNNGDTPLVDDGTNGDLISGDGIYSRDVTIANAGITEWKVFGCGAYATSFPSGNNSWVSTTTAAQTVKFTFDANNHAADAGLAFLPAQNIVNAWDSTNAINIAGDFQSTAWTPGDPATLLADAGGNRAFLTHPVSKGTHEYKFVRGGDWQSFGSFGRELNTGNDSVKINNVGDSARFLFDFVTGRRFTYAPPPPPTASHDNDIWWADLYFNSRDPFYRDPIGPVATGTAVTLRFRAAKGDLTAAQVRVYNDRTNAEFYLNMTVAVSDSQYDYWQAELPVSSLPTVYWVRFIAVDGSATAFYEDDEARTGGAGKVFAKSADNSWQVTVYDPTFKTPDWVKNGVIYQIFPDRFRDNVPANNKPAGSFFYNETGGTIVRSNTTDWNTMVCDPRAPGSCAGTYSKNFYGGDLKGITEKLDYLQSLGVTVLYLNPIFASPSNHRYDTTDYLKIDPSLGSTNDFQALANAARARGMRIILDGVFNHTSSDSLYFDRYNRYNVDGNLSVPRVNDGTGACESASSPFYSWFYFPAIGTPGNDGGVASTCPNGPGGAAQTFEAWFGYSSLPKLQANSTAARNLIWNTPGGVALYWLRQGASGWRLDVGGDVDPGTTNDPTNNYWEGFRSAVQTVKPDTYIVGEEWGNASSWLLGGEWDATMNYQYGSAMVSFWRDTPFNDNDHNPGSSAGVLSPLTPTQLDERLHNWLERYPSEALYAMMNLLDSHDTNRVLFQLDPNTALNDPSLYNNPNYDWAPAIERLKGVLLLQMTLPGAPTIYYGDEVGLVGAPAFDGSTWQDDPYNRQPFPWLDASGTPFYTHLQTAAGQDALRDYYKNLITARNAHPALRTGSFDTLLVDDTNNVYAYGRRMADFSDAAVTVINRKASAQDITVSAAGYLPAGAQFTDVLSGSVITVAANGSLSLSAVPGLSGAVLVYTGGTPLTAPAAVTTLAVTGEGNTTVTLGWSGVSGADVYDVYRSIASGGGYVKIGDTSGTTYTDTGLNNAQYYYYVIRSRNSVSGLASGYSNEAAGMPHLVIGWAGNLWPPTMTKSATTAPSGNIYLQVWIGGATDLPGPTPGLRVQVGYGPDTNSMGWTHWYEAAFNTQVGNNDEFVGTLAPETPGIYTYSFRLTTTNGRDWFYPSAFGTLTVTPSSDTTPPAAPTSLAVTDFNRSFIKLGWTASTEPDIYAYDVYRSTTPGSGYVKLARVLHPDVSYIDATVTTGVPYYYILRAVDTSFNPSGNSNEVSAIPQAKMVEITVNVTVPPYTAGMAFFSRVINSDNTLGPWSPSARALSAAGPSVWSTTFTLEEGTLVEYKITRGSWDTVEKAPDGTELPNRTFTATYGPGGKQTVDISVAAWRDPLVTAHTPANGAAGLVAATPVTWTWSKAVDALNLKGTVSVLGGASVAGSLGYDPGTMTVTFTPTAPLAVGQIYVVTVSGQASSTGDMQQVEASWTFTVGYRTILPILLR